MVLVNALHPSSTQIRSKQKKYRKVKTSKCVNTQGNESSQVPRETEAETEPQGCSLFLPSTPVASCLRISPGSSVLLLWFADRLARPAPDDPAHSTLPTAGGTHTLLIPSVLGDATGLFSTKTSVMETDAVFHGSSPNYRERKSD